MVPRERWLKWDGDPSIGVFSIQATAEVDKALLLGMKKPKDYVVRVYILTGLRLQPKDADGSSDPYLVAQLGKTKLDTRSTYIKNHRSDEADFYRMFEFNTQLPGDSMLRVDVMDACVAVNAPA